MTINRPSDTWVDRRPFVISTRLLALTRYSYNGIPVRLLSTVLPGSPRSRGRVPRTPVIHIRERLETGRFTTSGITLDEEEYGVLMALGSSVLEALRQLVNGPPNAEGTWSRSIGDRGRRVVVSRFRGSGYVNIRNYWAPRAGETPRPTRIGITLGANAFQKLLDYDLFINDDLNTMVRLSAERRRQEEDQQHRLDARREIILLSAGQATAVAEKALHNLLPLPRSQEMNTNTIPSIPPPP